MTLSFMHRIDSWVGIPACFLLSLWHALLGRRSPSISKPIRRVLFIELSEMGSAILAYPAIQKIKTDNSNADLFFLIFAKNRESVDLLEIIPFENVICIRDTHFWIFAWDSLKALQRIRRLKMDIVIDLELFSRFTSLFSYACGASRRLGFHNFSAEGLYRGNWITHPVFYNPHYHMSQNFLAMAHAAQKTSPEHPAPKQHIPRDTIRLPRPNPGEKNLQLVKERLRHQGFPDEPGPVFICNPDPGKLLPLRGWPLHHFIRLITGLLRENAQSVVLIMGLASSAPQARHIIDGVKNARCIDFTGQTSNLREMLALFSFGDILIGNDSGPAHIASLTDIRSLTLFGPETPALYGPLGNKSEVLYANFACSPCFSAANHRGSLCQNNRCLQAIAPETVQKHLSTLLEIKK